MSDSDDLFSNLTDEQKTLVEVVQRLGNFYREAMESAGFSEEEIREVENGVMQLQLLDLLGNFNL